jgi:hypothetical protein
MVASARWSNLRASTPLRAVLRCAEAENAFGHCFAELVRIAAIQALRHCVRRDLLTTLFTRREGTTKGADAALNRLPRLFGTFVLATPVFQTPFKNVSAEQAATLLAGRRLDTVLHDTALDRGARLGRAFVFRAAICEALSQHVSAELVTTLRAGRRRAMFGDAPLCRLAGPRCTRIFATTVLDTAPIDSMAEVTA